MLHVQSNYFTLDIFHQTSYIIEIENGFLCISHRVASLFSRSRHTPPILMSKPRSCLGTAWDLGRACHLSSTEPEPMFIGSRTYVHRAGNLCYWGYEPMFLF